MGKTSSAMPITLGFLTVVEQSKVGYIGGYLVLNSRARPIEFHCTAPIQPSRAQQVLYGKTLKPYLYGEQIATALVDRSKVRPIMFFTDLTEVIEARVENNLPIVWIQPCETQPVKPAEVPGTQRHYRRDAAHPMAEALRPTMEHFTLGSYQVATHSHFADDAATVRSLWQQNEALDLLEPFERIREAIHEAQRPSK